MYKQIVTKLWLTILLFLTCVGLAAGQAWPSVTSMLAGQKLIRFYSADSPNFGDQAATYNLIQRIRQMGFGGECELVYSSAIREKIALLYGLPASLPDVYRDAVHGITFLTVSAFNARVSQGEEAFVDLAMTGAHGGFIDAHSKLFVVINNYLKNPDISDNELSIGIWQGSPMQRVWENRDLSTYVKTPVSNLQDTLAYLEKTASGRAFAGSVPGLMPLLSLLQTEKINFLPVYGAPFKTYRDEQASRMQFPSIILQTLAGARVAQLQLNNRPVVVAVFADYINEAKKLQTLTHMDNWQENEIPGAAHARDVIRQLGLDRDLVVGSLSDPKIPEILENLHGSQIMLLSMGTMPKVVFDGIYTHTATNVWPQIREGASTLNQLILSGKPHIRCGVEMADENWEPGFTLVGDAQLLNDLKVFYSNYCVRLCAEPDCPIKGWENNDMTYQLLGNMLVAGSNPHSALAQYFQLLQKQGEMPENDRIYQALEHARQLL